MQTDTITLICSNTSGGFTCTTPSIFSGGEMFISLLLLVFLIVYIIELVVKAVFYVDVHKKYLGINQLEGKENYKI
jgi:hypothetical protein